MYGELPESRTVYLVGGCHVTGSPVPFEYLFSAQLRSRLSELGYELSIGPKTTVACAPEHLRRMGTRPACIILQLGHRETLFPVRRKWLSQGDGGPAAHVGSLDIKHTLWSLLRSLGTLLLAYSPTRLRRFEKRQFQNAVQKSFARIAAEYPDIPVMVMSTFPAVNMYRLMIRHQANSVLRSEASRYGWHYLDVFRKISIVNPALFCDNCHLSRAGHGVVADLVYKALMAQPENLTHAKSIEPNEAAAPLVP